MDGKVQGVLAPGLPSPRGPIEAPLAAASAPADATTNAPLTGPEGRAANGTRAVRELERSALDKRRELADWREERTGFVSLRRLARVALEPNMPWAMAREPEAFGPSRLRTELVGLRLAILDRSRLAGAHPTRGTMTTPSHNQALKGVRRTARDVVEGMGRILDDPATYAMLAIGFVTFGRAGRLLLGPIHRSTWSLAGGLRAGDVAGVAVSTAVDAAAFHSGMNLFNLARGERREVSWSPASYLGTALTFELLALAKVAHLRRSLYRPPRSRFAEAAFSARHLGEEIAAIASPTIAMEALRRDDRRSFGRALKDSAELVFAMRLLGGVERLRVNARRRRRGPAVVDSTLSQHVRKQLFEIFADLRREFPELPTRVLRNQRAKSPAITEQTYRGGLHVITLSRLGPMDRSRLVERLRQEAERRKLEVEITIAGTGIDITHPLASKASALDRFVKMTGVPVDEIYKFGDRAGPDGNDRTLLIGKNAFNVGREDCLSNVHTTGAEGPAGVVEVLSRLWPSRVRAIATDCDRTLTNHEGTELDPHVRGELVRFLNGGTKVAIITARGPAVISVVMPELMSAGLSEAGVAHLSFALYGGSVFEPAAIFLPSMLDARLEVARAATGSSPHPKHV